MPNLNKILLIGHLGGDPEAKVTQNGKNVVNFTLATSEKYGDKEQTQWHKIIMWDKLAELATKYLSKGDCVYLEGKVTYRDYMDKENIKRYITEVTAFNMQFIKTKKQGEGSQNNGHASDENSQKQGETNQAGQQYGADDTPF